MFLILALQNWINKTSPWRTLRSSRKLTNWHSLQVSGIRPCWTCTHCVNRHFLTGRSLPDSCSRESRLFRRIIIKPPHFFPLLFPLLQRGIVTEAPLPGNKLYSSYVSFSTGPLLINQLGFDIGRTKVSLAWLSPSLLHTRYNAATLWLVPICSAAHTRPALGSCKRASWFSLQGRTVAHQLTWHTVGMPPGPTCPHNRQRRKKTPLPVVINYKPLVRSHGLSHVSAGASYKDSPSWKAGCRNAKLYFSDRHHLLYVYPSLQILIEVADPFGARRIHPWKCEQNQAAIFLNIPSLYWLSISWFSLFFSPIALFFISFPPLGKRKTHTQKNTAGQEIKPFPKDALVRRRLFTHLFCTDYFL